MASAQETRKALEIVAPLAADAVKEPLNVTLAQVPKSNAEVVRTVSRQPEPIENEKPSVLAEPQKRRGLFPNLTNEKTRKGTDARDVPFGTILPFGKVARVCEAKDQGALGHFLDRSAATGVAINCLTAPRNLLAHALFTSLVLKTIAHVNLRHHWRCSDLPMCTSNCGMAAKQILSLFNN